MVIFLELEVPVLDVTLMSHTTFIRGYNFSATLNVTLMNNNRDIPIDPVVDPWTNYNVEILLSHTENIDASHNLIHKMSTLSTTAQLQRELPENSTITLSSVVRSTL